MPTISRASWRSTPGSLLLRQPGSESFRRILDSGRIYCPTCPTAACSLSPYWVDDFWGTLAWNWWSREFSRVLPPGEFPIADIAISHPIMHSVYDVKEFLQVSNIGFWRGSGLETSERVRGSDEVHFRGVEDLRGRLIVLMTQTPMSQTPGSARETRRTSSTCSRRAATRLASTSLSTL